MNQQDPYLNLIFAVLQKAVSKRTFNSQRAQSLYEKGYLVGLLASLARGDSAVYSIIKNQLKK